MTFDLKIRNGLVFDGDGAARNILEIPMGCWVHGFVLFVR